MRTASLLIALLCLSLLAPTALAQDNGRVVEVTVFPDRAQVTRQLEAAVTAGDGQITVKGLPRHLDRDGLRVRAEGPEGLSLGSVESRVVRGREQQQAQARALEARIRELEDERQAVQYRIETLDIQLTLARSLAESPGEGEIRPGQWAEAFAAVGSGASEAYQARFEAEQLRRDMDQELQRLRQQLEDLGNSGTDSVAVSFGYRSPSAGTARFYLDYVVPEARWLPDYRLALDTDEQTLTVTQQARVRQNTGEDWDGVTLRLSTSQPALGGRLPELQPWYIDVRQPAPERRARGEAAPRELDRVTVTGSRMDESDLLMAAVEGSAFVTEYRVPGRATVPADNSHHRFGLDQHELAVELSARAVPVRQAMAYLHAEGEYRGEVPLLAGPASLIQDGDLVGQGLLDSLAPGATLAQAFGVDPRIEISHSVQKDERGSEGMIRKRQWREQLALIEVSNRHDRAMTLTLQDRLPVARDERIEVSLSEDSDTPDARDVGDRPGVVEWQLTLEPGESRRLHFGYRASWPADIEGIQGW